MSAFQPPVTLVVRLRTHEAILAALHAAAMIGSEARAVVMVKGYNDDWRNFNALYLSEYHADDLANLDCFAAYRNAQLWITIQQGVAR